VCSGLNKNTTLVGYERAKDETHNGAELH